MKQIKLVSVLHLEQRRAKLLRNLLTDIPPLDGSLYKAAVTCGSPTCKCARGEKHVSYQLTRKEGGKTKTLHIPVDMVDEVRKWTEENQRIKKQLAEIYELGREIIECKRAQNRVVSRSKRNLPGSSAISPAE